MSQVGSRSGTAYWARIAGINLAAALAVTVVFSGMTLKTPAGQWALAFFTSFVFSTCIAPLLGYLMPRLAPWIWCRMTFPFNWAAIFLTMIVLAVLGSIAAIGILTMIGYLPPGRFLAWLYGSLKIAIVVTVTAGSFVTIYEMMQARLGDGHRILLGSGPGCAAQAAAAIRWR